MEMTGFCS